MTNLDREELRNRLKTTHESQGIRKSVAMKLMQELDETEAKWRKEWGRANELQSKLDDIRLALETRYFEEYFWGGEAIMTLEIENILDRKIDDR